jgi:DNA polymerase-3 subunit delta
MSFNEIFTELKANIFKPIYFLCGEETYFIDKIEGFIEANALEESTKDFNFTMFYGKDADPIEIINTCMRPPNFAEKQLVIIREAQQLKSLDFLEKYIEKPNPTTILAISYKYKTPDKRTAFGKAIQSKSVYYEAEKIKEEKIIDWIINLSKEQSMIISAQHANLLKECIGTDLSKIINELDKLKLVVGNGTITDEHIEKQIGISREFNVLELSNAFQSKNIPKAILVVDYFSKNPKAGPVPLVIATLYGFFSKLLSVYYMQTSKDADIASAIGASPYAIKNYRNALSLYTYTNISNAIHTLAIYDKKSKGIDNNSNDAALLNEMVFKIMQ